MKGSRVGAIVSLIAGALLATFSPITTSAATMPLRVLVRTPDPRSAGVVAVGYAGGGNFVGVAHESGSDLHVYWSRRVPYPVVHLRFVDNGTLLVGVGRRVGTHQGEVFGFRLTENAADSAITGVPSGVVIGARGVSLHGEQLLVRNPDTAHTGSVVYQVVQRFSRTGNSYVAQPPVRRPDYAAGQLPCPCGVIRTAAGDTILIRLEVAATEAAREQGLMNRTSLDPDSGMLFSWTAPVLESFWMENTYIPLTVAFLSPAGTIQEMQDMDPLTTTLHTPLAPYQYAIEANRGFFAENGIKVGDTVKLDVSSSG